MSGVVRASTGPRARLDTRDDQESAACSILNCSPEPEELRRPWGGLRRRRKSVASSLPGYGQVDVEHSQRSFVQGSVIAVTACQEKTA